MYALDALPVDFAMQNRNIAKAHNPLRILFEGREVQVIHNSACAIPAPRTHYRPDVLPVEHFLEVFGAFKVCACKNVVALIKVFAQYHFQAPTFQNMDSVAYFLRLNLFGRGDNAHFVAYL